MILACHNIKKSYGTQVIIAKGSFHIEAHEKTALVGQNGAGKTTLLKLIMNELPLDEGEVILAKGSTIGYLSQHQESMSGNNIYQEVKTARSDVFLLEEQIRNLEQELKSLSGQELKERLDVYHRLTAEFEQKNGYACESEIVGVLKGLGFSEAEFGRKVEQLSGGQKTRVALGKLLLTKPDVLLLDEPTNHLDLNSIAWLENFLINYSGAVLIVSHDRYFLNRVVTRVIEIDQGELLSFQGGYSDYAEKKQLLREAQLKAYYSQQQEIKHHEAVIQKLKSFNREKSIKRAESREKMLSRITPLEKPSGEDKKMLLTLEPSVISGKDVLSVEHLSKSYPSARLFQDISFILKRGEHTAIIGDNGTGKTTLLNILNQVADADSGSYTLGTNVTIGYYDQEHQVLDETKTLFEELSDAYPTLNNTSIRNTLAAFLFTGDDVYKRIGDLSGGERGRASLAKLMLSEANLLILDEPTNHLDIASREILEQALNSYTGTVLYVSHDRYFINQTATRILDLVNHTFVNYLGNYDYYLEKKDALIGIYAPDTSSHINLKGEESETKLDWQEQKKHMAAERKRQNDLKKTEVLIQELEHRDKEIDTLLTQEDIYTNSLKVQELSHEKETLLTELEHLYEIWETLAD